MNQSRKPTTKPATPRAAPSPIPPPANKNPNVTTVSFIAIRKIEIAVLDTYQLADKVCEELNEAFSYGDAKHTLISQEDLFGAINDLELDEDDENDPSPEGIIEEIKDFIGDDTIMIDIEN
jgi:hypothetical protein